MRFKMNMKMNEIQNWMKINEINENPKNEWKSKNEWKFKNERSSKMNEIQKWMEIKIDWNWMKVWKMNENKWMKILKLMKITSWLQSKNEWMKPLYNIHTMINPYWSLEVNFWWISFQLTTWIWPLWPSRVWFIARLDGAAKPLIFPSLDVSSFKTFKRPSSPPQAMWPWSLFQEIHFSLVLLGMAIWN